MKGKGLNTTKVAFMISILLILSLSLIGCGSSKGNETENDQSSDQTTQAESTTEESAKESAATEANAATGAANEWPKELVDWAIPQPENGKIVYSDNRSVSGNNLTQGITVTVNMSDLKPDQFKDYCTLLEQQSFVLGDDSLGDVMMFYNKAIDDGELKLTISYTDNALTLIVTNTAVEKAKAEALANGEGQAAGDSNWPESAKDIPAFTYGTLVETVEMGGGMYALTYSGVTEDHLKSYRKTLLDDGFFKQDNADSEGYGKIGANMGYSVGMSLDGDVLMLIVLASKN